MTNTITSTLQRPWVLATLTALALGTSYIAYFDYKRRADPDFRRQLRKQRKVATKNAEATDASPLSQSDSTMSLASKVPGLQDLLNLPLPTTPEKKEEFFMEALSKGEALTKMGPQFFELAATCFYKALKVYPAPAELVMLYQRTVADPVFQLIMAKITEEVKSRQEQYFVEFPAADFNVRVRAETDPSKPPMEDGTLVKRRLLVATRDFDQGEVIYSEDPLVASVLPQHLLSGNVCTYCLRATNAEFRVISTRSRSAFCSKQCEQTAWDNYESLLFADHDSASESSTVAAVQQLAKSNAQVPLTMMRFLAQMVREDMAKATNPSASSVDSFGAWDHIERLKYLELTPDSDDTKHMEILRKVIGEKVPGLDEFLTEERYMMLKGKFLYNQMAIISPGHIDIDSDMESTTMVTSDSDPMRLGGAKCGEEGSNQISGTGVYPVTAYLGHHCTPNTRVTYPKGNNKLELVAMNAITKGDVLTTAYVNVEAGLDVTARTNELKKWRYACTCPNCEEEKLDVE